MRMSYIRKTAIAAMVTDNPKVNKKKQQEPRSGSEFCIAAVYQWAKEKIKRRLHRRFNK